MHHALEPSYHPVLYDLSQLNYPYSVRWEFVGQSVRLDRRNTPIIGVSLVR